MDLRLFRAYEGIKQVDAGVGADGGIVLGAGLDTDQIAFANLNNKIDGLGAAVHGSGGVDQLIVGIDHKFDGIILRLVGTGENGAAEIAVLTVVDKLAVGLSVVILAAGVAPADQTQVDALIEGAIGIFHTAGTDVVTACLRVGAVQVQVGQGDQVMVDLGALGELAVVFVGNQCVDQNDAGVGAGVGVIIGAAGDPQNLAVADVDGESDGLGLAADGLGTEDQGVIGIDHKFDGVILALLVTGEEGAGEIAVLAVQIELGGILGDILAAAGGIAVAAKIEIRAIIFVSVGVCDVVLAEVGVIADDGHGEQGEGFYVIAGAGGGDDRRLGSFGSLAVFARREIGGDILVAATGGIVIVVIVVAVIIVIVIPIPAGGTAPAVRGIVAAGHGDGQGEEHGQDQQDG